MLEALKPWQKLSYHLSTNNGEKTTFDKILSWQIKNTDSYLHASARPTLCKLATCTRQTFLLAKQAETITNNKRSKTNFGYY